MLPIHGIHPQIYNYFIINGRNQQINAIRSLFSFKGGPADAVSRGRKKEGLPMRSGDGIP